ncbi:MAG: DMT family transporter [Lysobacter sp.]|nr:DMT family transporter [Lysobacter sp.]
MPERHFGRRDIALALLICTVWAGNFLTSAHALREIPPFLFSALRMGMLAVLLCAFVRLPPRAQWPRLIAVALLNGALHFGTSLWALRMAGDLSSPAIVMQSYIPMSVLLAWWLLGERFAWRTGSAIALSFAGVLVLGFDPLVLDHPASLAMMLLAAFLIALGTVFMRGLSGIDALNLQGWTALIGIAPLLIISALIEPDGFAALRDAHWSSWGAALYSAVFASLIGHSVFYRLVQRHPVATVMPYLLLTPVFAVALGILVWGDRPGPQLWIGGAMVLGGVLVIALRARAKALSTH